MQRIYLKTLDSDKNEPFFAFTIRLQRRESATQTLKESKMQSWDDCWRHLNFNYWQANKVHPIFCPRSKHVAPQNPAKTKVAVLSVEDSAHPRIYFAEN